MSLPKDKYQPKVPDGYFNNLNKKIESRLEEEELFNVEQYPFLFNVNKEEDFIVPSDYFNLLDPSNKIRIKKSASKFQLMTLLASFIFAGIIFALSIKKEMPESNEIEVEEIIQYFASDYDDLEEFHDDELELLLTAESEYSFIDVEKDVLLNYLIENSDQLDLTILY